MGKMGNKDAKVIIVDDNIVFRNGLKYYLQNELNCSIIGEASGGSEFFALPNLSSAHIVLMDLQIPEMDGYAITKKFLINFSYIPVLAITMHSEKAYLMELIDIGFKGCVFKPEIFRNIEHAISKLINKGYYFPEDINFKE